MGKKLIDTNEQSPREMQDTIKKNNIHVMGMPKGVEQERSQKFILRNNGIAWLESLSG